MKVKVEAFETYPAGIYPATVREITLDTESQFGSQFRFKFELGGALAGKSLTGWCKQSGSVKSKFYEWYVALTGTTPKPGEELDSDLLIGRTATAVVKVKPKDDGTTKNVIDSLMPLHAPVEQPAAPVTGGNGTQAGPASKGIWNEIARLAKMQGFASLVEQYRPSKDSDATTILKAADGLRKHLEAETQAEPDFA